MGPSCHPRGWLNYRDRLACLSHLGEIAVLRAWGGIEGYTPDDLPIIGRGSHLVSFTGSVFGAWIPARARSG